MGANLANEIAEEKFSETTIGKFFWPENELDLGMFIFRLYSFKNWMLYLKLDMVNTFGSDILFINLAS